MVVEEESIAGSEREGGMEGKEVAHEAVVTRLA